MQYLARSLSFALPVALGVVSFALVGQSQNQAPKLDPSVLANAPTVPQMIVDSDGALHFGPRTVPPAALESKEARASYTRQMIQKAQASEKKGGLAAARMVEGAPEPPPLGASKQTALKIYGVTEETSKIGGVGVTIYSPKQIPAKNRRKVALEFEMDAEAIAVASLGRMKVIKVNYRGGGPSIPGNEDIVAVYRELLKTYKPKSIAMFGASGGCTLAQTTILWLPVQKLPLPGAVGLGTCSGGSNQGDARYTMNGLDAGLSSAFSGQAPYHPGNMARKPDDPPATALDGDIPKGYPPAFLLSGTRDMCLSQTVLLHRKLLRAGVEADLNVFEGMWHFFWEDPSLPESREAMTALANFFNRHLQ
ncbi:MAG TPA: alpha/beta hydrolase [Bryobacteraceae bacterium]|nr:alpha/beta hydrolase [Bryobacteraceae bacterium]